MAITTVIIVDYKNLRESQFFRKRVLKNNKLLIISKYHKSKSDASCATRKVQLYKSRSVRNMNKTKFYNKYSNYNNLIFNEMHDIKRNVILEIKIHKN